MQPACVFYIEIKLTTTTKQTNKAERDATTERLKKEALINQNQNKKKIKKDGIIKGD